MSTARDFKSIFQQHQAGLLQKALAGYLELIEHEPQHVEAQVSLATLYLQRGELANSAEHFETALALAPRHLLALHNYAICLKRQRQYEQALLRFDQAIAVDPHYELAYKNKFSLLASMGRQAERLEGLQQALEALPHSADLTLLLVADLRATKQYNLALEYVDKLLGLNPVHASAHNARGNLLLDLGRGDEAIHAYQSAISLRTDYARAHGNLALAYFYSADYEKALVSFGRALELDPDLPGMRNNLANTLQNLHRFDEALRTYDEVLTKDPTDTVAAANKGMLCLLLGRFKEGWPLYESRWKNAHLSVYPEVFEFPLWDGRDSLQGKSIILHAEQGLGDTFQFCRYARILARQAGKVYLVVNASMDRLMRISVGHWPESRHVEVVSAGATIPAFHYQLPLLSAPRVLGTDLDSIPNDGPYLYADDESLVCWRERLGESRVPRIGIVWSGSGKHTNDHNRSLQLSDVVKAFQSGLHFQVEFHSLQKEVKGIDALGLESLPVHDHAQHLLSFSDTAALIAHMDLVISVDTSVAHLSAALGKPTWVLLSHVPDFRWMLDRGDSPWYSSVRLFRQPRPRDWQSVLWQVTEACNAHFQAQPDPNAFVPMSRMNLANRLIDQGQWQEAEHIIREESATRGRSAKLQNNWGVALQKLRRFDEALEAFDRAMQLDPDYVSPRLNKAYCLLALGSFDEGWPLYEWRWKNPKADLIARCFSQPLWLGEEDIKGKTLLVYAEQGLGDTLQFCRLLDRVQSLGAQILFEVPAALLALLRASLSVPVYAEGASPQSYDYQCPLMSLPLALKVRFDEIPSRIPYLRVEAPRQARWYNRLGASFPMGEATQRLKIGLAWAGSARHANDAQRSLSFSLCGRLLQLDADIYILQKGLTRSDRVGLEILQRFGRRIFILDSDLEDFSDTAAVINCLDRVVSVDTAVAHLAGALGKPLYLLLPYEADFRWLQTRSDSPWYPSARLFRQQKVGDWTEPLGLLVQQLEADVRSKKNKDQADS